MKYSIANIVGTVALLQNQNQNLNLATPIVPNLPEMGGIINQTPKWDYVTGFTTSVEAPTGNGVQVSQHWFDWRNTDLTATALDMMARTCSKEKDSTTTLFQVGYPPVIKGGNGNSPIYRWFPSYKPPFIGVFHCHNHPIHPINVPWTIEYYRIYRYIMMIYIYINP